VCGTFYIGLIFRVEDYINIKFTGRKRGGFATVNNTVPAFPFGGDLTGAEQRRGDETTGETAKTELLGVEWQGERTKEEGEKGANRGKYRT